MINSLSSYRERFFLITLAFLSGAAGLSYEVLYARVLSVYFGDVYFIIAAILMSTFLGLAVGYLLAHRLVTYLWAIEALLGLYALATAYVFSNFGLEPTRFLAYSNTSSIFLVCVVAFIPFFLTGISVPAFAFLLRAVEKKAIDKPEKPFTLVYITYNIGAAVVVLLAEFFLIRAYGISASIIAFASVNLIIAPFLFPLCRCFVTSAYEPNQTHFGNFSLTLALLVIGFSSTIYQLSYLEYCWRLFGPTPMVFAIILFSALLGIVIGSVLSRWLISLQFIVSLLAIFIPLLFLFTEPLVNIWSYTAGLTQSVAIFSLYKNSFIVLFGLPVFILFGASVPLGIRAASSASYGHILATVSFGNALGVLALLTFLKDTLSFIGIVFILVGLLLFVGLVLSKKSFIEWRREWVVGAACSFCCLIFFFSYPHKLSLLGSHAMLYSKEWREGILNDLDKIEEIKQNSDSAVIYHWKDGLRGLMHLGYLSLSKIRKYTIYREKAHSVLPSLYSKQHNDALVIALGTGITATEAANRYKNVTIVDINPAMLKVSKILSKENDNLLDKENVSIHIQDGIVELARAKKKYDLFLNSFSPPNYYSTGKLYTKEFFAMAKQSLSPGGVYVGWIYMLYNYSVDDVLIHLNTLKNVFSQCHHYFINWKYFLHVCGENLVRREPVADDQFGQWLSQLQIKTFEEDFRRVGNANSVISTLDHPVLSFKELNFRITNAESDYVKITDNWGLLRNPKYQHGTHICCQQASSHELCEPLFALTGLKRYYCREFIPE